ncbi:MAG TPA: PQQ-dependent sugar dehydrogenase [Candidatus Saccharimonadia bacterium]
MITKRYGIYIVVAAAGIGLMVLAGTGHLQQFFFKPTPSLLKNGVVSKNDNSKDIETIAQNLTVPWGIAFLPGGDLLVTERSGTLQRIGKDNQKHAIDGVQHVGEGGLLGVALDPKFSANHRIYLYMTTKTGNALTNRIERYVYENRVLSQRQIILQNIPGEANHDGGRLAFGPDGFLYVTTGDAGNSALAQNKSSLAGKILRLTADGLPAPGNPLNSTIYSYGHRNPQGLAWDKQGQLWATEHGRSGIQSGFDELNLIKPGANYGWPLIQGDETRPGMEKPVAHSGPNETWAPASLAYANGSLFFGGLRGESLYEATITGDNTVALQVHFRGGYGRLRTVAVNNQALYVTTSNTDGRGQAKPGDDKVIRIKLSVF